MSSSVLVDRLRSEIRDRVDPRVLAGSILIEVAILYVASFVVVLILIAEGGTVGGESSFVIEHLAVYAIPTMILLALPVRLAAGVSTYLRGRIL